MARKTSADYDKIIEKIDDLRYKIRNTRTTGSGAGEERVRRLRSQIAKLEKQIRSAPKKAAPRDPKAAKKPASKSAPKVNTTRAFVLTPSGKISKKAKGAGWEPRMHGGKKVAYNTTTKKSFYI